MGKASLSVAAILALTFFLSFWAASGAIYNVPESAIKAAAETEIKPRAEPIEVFVVPHSHDDVGWIVTMEEYFTSEVQYIYDTVLQCLLHDSRRRFIIVEVGYLKRWWEQASNQSQSDMLHLYKNGQIEFIIGGIVMSDEAAASYVARVNQLQEGHKFLTEHFGAIPRIGWQIDPFGASVGTPVLQAWDCFDALVIARIPYWQKTNRENNKTMEFIWHGTTNLGQETDMFTHVMDDYGYCTPNGFAFGDSWNIYEPPNPNPPVEKYNIALRAAELVKNIQSRAAWFQTNNLLFAFGCDFNYQNAWTMYKNMDKLIDYINERQDKFGVHLKYSLLSDYFDAIHQTQTSWPEYTGDFFPYNDNNVSYWTGYYTSRNKLKGMTREADNTQRVADIAVSLVKGLGALVDQSGVYDLLRLLRFQNAVAQHHDGVSGTARPQVVDDYELRIKEGTIANNIVIEEYVAQDLSKNGVHPLLSLNQDYMHLDLKSGKTVATVVQNTLAWNRTDFVQLHIPSGIIVNVTDSNGNPVPSQIDAGKPGENKDSLWFQANIPALGISTYFLTPVKTGMPTTSVRSKVIHDYIVDFRKEGQSAVLHPRSKLNVMANPIQISNGQLTLGFNNATGLVNTVYSKSLNKTITVTQDYLEYNSSADPEQSSGAYIFRNNGTAVSLSKYTDTFNIQVVSGPLVQTVHQTWEMTVNISSFTPKYKTNVTQSIRLLTSSDPYVNNRIDVRHGVGPLDGNKEFITRWVTPIASNLYFYQDDSGFLTMQRRYNSSQSLPIPGNYYPMVSTSYIQDSTQRLTVISAQSHGCASLANGELEVMLHRRTLQDDGRGVGAPLNDTNRLDMPHFILYDSPTASEQARHRLRLMLDFPLTVLYGTLSSSNISTWTSKYATSLSPLANPLPPNLHMLNLQIFDGSSDTIVLRLQHLFQAGSDPTYAVPVTINLSSLFNSNYVITNVVPLTLSANQNLSTCQSKRWTWNSQSSIGKETQVPVSPLADDRVTVTIQPSQILTFSIHLSPNV